MQSNRILSLLNTLPHRTFSSSQRIRAPLNSLDTFTEEEELLRESGMSLLISVGVLLEMLPGQCGNMQMR